MRRYVQRDLRHCRLAVCTEVGPLHRSNVLETQYRKVMLPLILLRRLDCVLETFGL